MPTALQTLTSYVVFAEGGPHVYDLSPSMSDPYTLPEGTWALSDSNMSLRQPSPCVAFIEATYTNRAHVIVASSPAEHRYKELLKEYRLSTYVMDGFLSHEFIGLG